MKHVYKLYGIPNCDTVKRARVWLDANQVTYEFQDFKKLGVSAELLKIWLTQYPHEKLINRAGLTWRSLDDVTKTNIVDSTSAIALMQVKTSLIKRPVLEKDSKIIYLGFDEAGYIKLLSGRELLT